MGYLSYDEYQDMGGSLDETAFDDIEYEAGSYIDWYTFRRLVGEEDIPEEVKKCEYHLIKLIDRKLQMMNIPVGSETSSTITTSYAIRSQENDGVSISYEVPTVKEVIDNCTAEIDKIIKRELDGIRNSLGHRLLYRGIYPGEKLK